MQGLARRGRRISVLLIGEDSLEANVGQLAALTGGDLFIVTARDAEATFVTAVESLRRPAGREAAATEAGAFRAFADGVEFAFRRGERLVSRDQQLPRAVAALHAGFLQPTLRKDQAAALAEAEGLVTHLTSMVLVDDAGDLRPGLPTMRKVPLAEPHMPAERRNASTRRLRSLAGYSEYPRERGMFERRAGLDAGQMGDRESADDIGSAMDWPELERLGAEIDWNRDGPRLAAGALDVLTPALQTRLILLLELRGFQQRARSNGVDPFLLLIWLLARSQASVCRGAARVDRVLAVRHRDVDITDVVSG